MIDCVLFDLDGTLIDTAPDFISVLNAQRIRHQLPPLPEDEIRCVVSGGARQMVKLAFGGDPGEAKFDARLTEFLNDYSQVITPEKCLSRLFPGLDQHLQELVANNINWGIVTNKPERFAIPLLQALNLNCPVLICPDHVANTKPDPEPLLLACEHLNCDPKRTIYVGDHERDIEAGLKADMATIVANWGYFDEPNPLEQWQAHYLAEDAQQLSAIVNNLHS